MRSLLICSMLLLASPVMAQEDDIVWQGEYKICVFGRTLEEAIENFEERLEEDEMDLAELFPAHCTVTPSYSDDFADDYNGFELCVEVTMVVSCSSGSGGSLASRSARFPNSMRVFEFINQPVVCWSDVNRFRVSC